MTEFIGLDLAGDEPDFSAAVVFERTIAQDPFGNDIRLIKIDGLWQIWRGVVLGRSYKLAPRCSHGWPIWQNCFECCLEWHRKNRRWRWQSILLLSATIILFILIW